MQFRMVSLAVLCWALAVIPASAQTQILYSNGPINGTVDAWTINFGYVVSDSFYIPYYSQVAGFDFGVWEFPGDTLSSVDWSITSGEFGGTVYGSGTAINGVNLADIFVSSNQYGYNIDQISVSTSNLFLYLNGGTYWLNLANATVPSGDPVYWDENSGPSSASESAVGTIPSEAFDISAPCINRGEPSCGPPTPEPSSIMLLGSGIGGLMGVLRRKLWKSN